MKYTENLPSSMTTNASGYRLVGERKPGTSKATPLTSKLCLGAELARKASFPSGKVSLNKVNEKRSLDMFGGN